MNKHSQFAYFMKLNCGLQNYCQHKGSAGIVTQLICSKINVIDLICLNSDELYQYLFTYSGFQLKRSLGIIQLILIL